MNKNVLKQIIIVTFSSTMLGCVSVQESASEDEPSFDSVRSDCIYEGTVRDYTVLDDMNLIVTATARRQYHIVLMRRAHELRSSWHIGLTSRTHMICAGSGSVVVDGGFGPEAVRIKAIRRLSAEEADTLLIQYGKKKPKVEQVPTPEPVEGAEIEELD